LVVSAETLGDVAGGVAGVKVEEGLEGFEAFAPGAVVDGALVGSAIGFGVGTVFAEGVEVPEGAAERFAVVGCDGAEGVDGLRSILG
jgi:hypothetical protein